MSLSIEQVQPVIVTAPTPWDGAILVQRLLNSSGQIIVYGENRHFCESLAALVHDAQWIHLTSHKSVEEARARFLSGARDAWSANLWPHTRMYLKHTVETFYGFVLFYQMSSERYGFQRWGIRHCFADVTAFDRFRRLLSRGRFLYVYRNLFDVARSAKARGTLATPDALEQLATTWSVSVNAVSKMQAENLRIIRYEELFRDAAQSIGGVESFTGVTKIKPDVLEEDRKGTREAHEHADSQPREAREIETLTEAEIETLRQHAGDVLEQLGYNNPRTSNATLTSA